MRITISPEAISDIDSIVAYGTDHWGYEAADGYSRGLRQHIKELADHPLRYPEAEKIRLGLRSFAHRRHRVFYLIDGEDIRIVRILHQQADWPRQIP